MYDFISEIDKIKNEVFSDKSKTFVGLRYYALRQISEKASSYMGILGTNVRRITLKEIDKKIVTELRKITNYIFLKMIGIDLLIFRNSCCFLESKFNILEASSTEVFCVFKFWLMLLKLNLPEFFSTLNKLHILKN